MLLCHSLDDRRIHAERLAGFAQRAVRPVRRDGGRQRCAIAAVLAVDVLHDFFAALMLEIDVDMVSPPILPIAVNHRLA